MRWRRRDRRTAHYQALGEDFLRRMAQRTAARCAAIKACHDGPEAMAALLDDLGERIAAERGRHGIPAPVSGRNIVTIGESYPGGGGWSVRFPADVDADEAARVRAIVAPVVRRAIDGEEPPWTANPSRVMDLYLDSMDRVDRYMRRVMGVSR